MLSNPKFKNYFLTVPYPLITFTYLFVFTLTYFLKKWCESKWGHERVYISLSQYLLLIFIIDIDLFFSAWLVKNKAIQKRLTESVPSDILFCLFVLSIILHASGLLYMIREQIWREKYAALSQRISEMKIEHYQKILQQNEEIRKYRHDMQNHLLVISNLLKEPETQESDALQYINQLRQSPAFQTNQYYSGSPVLDAIVQDTANKAEKNEIDFSFEGIWNSQIKMTEPDLCILFGNLLSNALEAAEKCDKGCRKIYLGIRLMQQTILIECKNSITQMDEQRLLSQPEQFKTSKKDTINHGFGLINIHEVVDKYQGDMMVEIADKCFSIKIRYSNATFRENNQR